MTGAVPQWMYPPRESGREADDTRPASPRDLWRIEDEQGLPVIHSYELDDTTRAYVATGVHREHWTTTVPFRLDLSPADLAR